jgi:hypothetical protein
MTSDFPVDDDNLTTTPPDAFGDDTPFGLTDQGDSLADDTDRRAEMLDHQGEIAPEAVRDPAGLATDGLEENPLG